MDQRDYILRMIEQAGRALIALRNTILGRAEDPTDVREQLERAARQGGVDLALARTMTPETLVMMVTIAGTVEPGRAWLLAETLYLDGLDALLTGDVDRAEDALERALMLYRLIGPGSLRLVGFPEMAERVSEIERLLEGGPPDPAA